jgi:hypothetical protein
MNTKRNVMLMAAASAIGMGLPTGASKAADLGCNGPCYEEAVPGPAYHRTLTRRVEIEKGAYEIAREPSLYGWVVERVPEYGGGGPVSYKDSGDDAAPTYREEKKRRILIRPYKNVAIYHRARHEYVKERVVIEPESTDWAPVSGKSWKD